MKTLEDVKVSLYDEVGKQIYYDERDIYELSKHIDIAYSMGVSAGKKIGRKQSEKLK